MDTPPQIPFDLSPKPSHSFDNFLVSESNAAAVAAVKAWPEWPSPILMLVGPQGSGKTHLGKAWQTFSGGLFIDEAHAMDEASLFKVMNQALNGDIPGLLLADRQAPQDWDTQMPDLRSRLSNTPIAMIDEHDDEILEPVVRKLFQDKGRDVSQGLISYLLKYQERSIAAQRIIASELEAAAQRQKADLTKAFAAKYLKERLERDLFAVPGEE